MTMEGGNDNKRRVLCGDVGDVLMSSCRQKHRHRHRQG